MICSHRCSGIIEVLICFYPKATVLQNVEFLRIKCEIPKTVANYIHKLQVQVEQ